MHDQLDKRTGRPYEIGLSHLYEAQVDGLAADERDQTHGSADQDVLTAVARLAVKGEGEELSRGGKERKVTF